MGLDSAEEVVNADVEKTEQVLQNPTTSILDDSQSLAALHVTSETSMLGDQDSDLSTQDKDGKTPLDFEAAHVTDSDLSFDSFIKDLASTDTSIHSSIFDDSQSLIALHVTSETSMLGDQDSDSAI